MSIPKILYIIGQLERGGAEQQFYYLLKHLKPRATVLSLSQQGYWANPIRKLGYEVIELKRVSHLDFIRLGTVIKIIRAQQPDIIHLFLDGVSGLYGRIAAFVNSHPCLIVGERRQSSSHPVWYSLIKRFWLNRYVAVTITNTRSSRDYLIAHDKLPPNKIKYIPNGLELDRFSVQDPLTRKFMVPESWCNKVIIGTVGNFHFTKAPDIFVKVAGNLLNHFPDARFVHVGDGPLRQEVESMSRTMGLQDFLHYLGRRDDVPKLLGAMDIFVLPSRSEGMPNAIMEAMAAGLPCVVTDVGDSKDLVHDGETGFVVPIGDVEQLADRIRLLMEDLTLRRRMGQKGLEKIKAFDVHRMVKEYKEVYHHALC